jgi:hypothetical protein
MNFDPQFNRQGFDKIKLFWRRSIPGISNEVLYDHYQYLIIWHLTPKMTHKGSFCVPKTFSIQFQIKIRSNGQNLIEMARAGIFTLLVLNYFLHITADIIVKMKWCVPFNIESRGAKRIEIKHFTFYIWLVSTYDRRYMYIKYVITHSVGVI